MVSIFSVVVSFVVVASLFAAAQNSSLWESPWKGRSIDCRRTNWLHTAKTGSTFCLAIQHACCKNGFEALTEGIEATTLSYAFGSRENETLAPFRYESQYCFKFQREGYDSLNCTFAGRPEHYALNQYVPLDSVMGMLMVREPKARVISAMLDGVHMEGFVNRSRNYELRQIFSDMDHDEVTPHHQKLLRKGELYAYHPELYGHQVKMLLNVMGMDLSQKTDELYPSIVDRAVEKLRQFFFVGIFEQYARSLRLFHELANVDTTPTPVELFPGRVTQGEDSAYLMEHLDYEDPYDSLLYQRAQQIFREELAFIKQSKGKEV